MSSKPGYLLTVLDNRCPRCRRGKLYESRNPYKLKTTLKMHKNCLECQQPFELEVGFYYGTSYVSYALTVAFSVLTFLLWWFVVGFSLVDNDSRLLYWLIANAIVLIVMQPLFMRLSRTLWLSWFVKYDPEWKEKTIDRSVTERIVKEQMNNW